MMTTNFSSNIQFQEKLKDNEFQSAEHASQIINDLSFGASPAM